MADNLNSVKTGIPGRKSYHHGDLREALMEAAETILRERGVTGFSLREAARRAGVSPGAPAHHFGDSRGLLTAVAARGFERLTIELSSAITGVDGAERLRSLGAAYLAFALENGPLFEIMWMRDLLDLTDETYLTAGRAAFNVLECAATGTNLPVATAARTPEPSVIAVWSLIHGLAKLTRDGALQGLPPGFQSDVLDFVPKLTST